jgi:hypothetical protein
VRAKLRCFLGAESPGRNKAIEQGADRLNRLPYFVRRETTAIPNAYAPHEPMLLGRWELPTELLDVPAGDAKHFV